MTEEAEFCDEIRRTLAMIYADEIGNSSLSLNEMVRLTTKMAEEVADGMANVLLEDREELEEEGN